MNNLNTEQRNILKKALGVKGELRQFRRFIQEEIIDKGYIEYLSDENFIEEMTKIDKRFKISIDYLNEKRENDISEYFKDKDGNLIISEKELNTIPIDRKDRYVYAKKMEEEEKFDFAKRIYKSIIDLGPDKTTKFYEKYKDDRNVKEEDIKGSTYYQSICSYYLCKVKNGERLTEKEKKEVNKLLKEDKIVIKEVLNEGADIEFILSILGEEIDIDKLEKEILPNIREDNEGKLGEEKGEIKGAPKTFYTSAELLEIFKGLGDIRKVTLGKEGLDGFILFTYDNLTIAEKFFKKDDCGDMIKDRAATYLIHKKARLDLEEATKGQLVEKKNQERHKKPGEELILSNNHTPGYRKNLKKSYDSLDKIEFNKKTGKIKVTGRKIREPRKNTNGKVTRGKVSRGKVSKRKGTERNTKKKVQEQDIQEQGTQVMESSEEPMKEGLMKPEDKEPLLLDENGLQENEIGRTDSSDLGEGEDLKINEQSEEVEAFSTSRRLIELTDEIGEADEKENDLINELNSLAEQKKELDEQMNKYKNDLSEKIGQNLSTQDKRAIIKKQIETLENIREKHRETMQLEEECKRKIEENSKRRKQLQEEFNTLLNGDGVDGR